MEKKNLFAWKGVNKQGVHVSGKTTAATRNDVKAELIGKGIVPLSIHVKTSESLFARLNKPKITVADVAVFCRQLATMISANTPLVTALDILVQGEENISLQEVLQDVRNSVSDGEPLSKALNKHKDHFDPLLCNLVAVGEQSGTLDKLLEQIAKYKEKMENIKKKIKKALFYPATIMIIAVAVVAVLLVFVVPQFDMLFKSFGKELPAFTQMIVNASNIIRSYWYIIIGIVVIVAWSFIKAKRKSEKFNYKVSSFFLRMPVFGKLLRKAIIARITRTLSITLGAGLPVVDALASIANITGNVVYTKAILKIRDEVAAGQSLELSMQATDLFPNLVVQMVTIGSQSGMLEDVLSKVAGFYEADVDQAIDALNSILEPFIIVFLGIIIGIFAAAMYLPIFKLGSVF